MGDICNKRGIAWGGCRQCRRGPKKVHGFPLPLPSHFFFLSAPLRYPTLYFVPANAKNSPKKYEGGREVKDFVDYIKKNRTTKAKSKEDL